MKFPSYLGALLVLGISASSLASIPRMHPELEQILSKKSPEKFSELKKLGPQVYQDLRKLAFNEDKTLTVRWQAFMAMVRLGEKESMPEVRMALKSRDWFMRDAALKVLPVLDEKSAYQAAVRSLNDSALVVRTSAVDALEKVGDSHCADLLWKQLYSRENYIHNESLWIRRHIVEALARLAPAGSEEKFIKVLDDKDGALYAPAISGLERLTHQKLGDETTPPVYRRFFWKKWFKEAHQNHS